MEVKNTGRNVNDIKTKVKNMENNVKIIEIQVENMNNNIKMIETNVKNTDNKMDQVLALLTPPTPAPVVTTSAPTELLEFPCDPNMTAVHEAMKHVTYGYALSPTTNPSYYNILIPFQHNKGAMHVFDEMKIAQYLTRNFHCDVFNNCTVISTSSISDFAQQLSIDTMVDREKHFLSKTMMASAAVSFKLITWQSTETFYTQSRRFINIGTSTTIPDNEDKTFIQSLMDPEVLNKIQQLETQEEEADDLVASLGVGYVSSVTLGSLFTLTSLVKRESWMTTTQQVTTAINAVGFSNSSSIPVTVVGSRRQTSVATFKLELYGADKASAGNIATWTESARQSPVIMNYQLSPILRGVQAFKYILECPHSSFHLIMDMLISGCLL